MRYNWPGNVREMRNFCERICILCEKTRAGAEDVLQALPGEWEHGEGADSQYADSQYAESRHAESRYAESRYAEVGMQKAGMQDSGSGSRGFSGVRQSCTGGGRGPRAPSGGSQRQAVKDAWSCAVITGAGQPHIWELIRVLCGEK